MTPLAISLIEKITDKAFNAVSGQREREGIKPRFEASHSTFS